jgi:hypothetical protein
MKIFFVLFVVLALGCRILVTNSYAAVVETTPSINEKTAFSSSNSPVVEAKYTGLESGVSALAGWANQEAAYQACGVYGRSDSTTGRGVLGSASSATGNTYGVYGYSSSDTGRGVYGYASSETGMTFGVSGSCPSISGRGVAGVASAPTGTTYGVYGQSNSSTGFGLFGYNTNNGYAMYSDGKFHCTGDMTIKTDKKIPQYPNKARAYTDSSGNPVSAPTVSASSEYNGGYLRGNAIDGIINRWDAGEWASNGETETTQPWIQLTWSSAQKISEVWIYDRPNKYDHIDDAYLLIDNNGDSIADQTLHLGMFPYGGAPKKIYLTSSEGTSVYSMKLVIVDTKETTRNAGLSEIECYYNPNSW